MSFNGSGTFVINSAGQPVVSGTVISSTAFNALTADLANGLSTCITKDGQTTPTADIPMGSNKITGLASGTAAGDAANLGQVQSTVAKLLGSVSGADTITAVGSPTVAAYAAGQMFYFVAAGANTGAVTINIDSLGAKNITRDGTTALAAGDIQSGEVCVIVYDGTQFQLVNGASQSAAIVTNSLTVNGTSSLDGAVTINDSGADVDFRVESDTNDHALFVQGSDGNVGIGTSSPADELDISAASPAVRLTDTTTAGLYHLFVSASDDLVISADNGDVSAGTEIQFNIDGIKMMVIDSANNVGINTASPDRLLHISSSAGNAIIRLERDDASISAGNVYGSIEFEGQDASSGASGVRGSIEGIAETSTGGMALVFSTAPSAGSNTERARISRDGELLVGTTSVLGASSAGSTHIVGGSNSVSQVPLYLRNPYSTAGRYWKTGPTNNAGYIVYNDSDTGLYVSYGGTSWVANSDESLKENISDVGSVINKLKNYRCINYSLKSSKSDAADKIGFIAQDWENDFPNTVSKADDGTLGIKYTETIPVLLKAIQEQQAMIEDLKAKVAALEGAK